MIILDSSVGRVRECVWQAGWQGATTRRFATCKEAQRSQPAGQACYRMRSGPHQSGDCGEATEPGQQPYLSVSGSGQLRSLG